MDNCTFQTCHPKRRMNSEQLDSLANPFILIALLFDMQELKEKIIYVWLNLKHQCFIQAEQSSIYCLVEKLCSMVVSAAAYDR